MATKTRRQQSMVSIQGFICKRIQGSAHDTEDVTGRRLGTILPQIWAIKCGNNHHHAEYPYSSVSQPCNSNGSRPPHSRQINDYECNIDSATENGKRNHCNTTYTHQRMQVYHTNDAPPTKSTSQMHHFGPATQTRALGLDRLLPHTRVFSQH